MVTLKSFDQIVKLKATLALVKTGQSVWAQFRSPWSMAQQ